MANFDLDYEGSEVQDILDTGKSLEDDGYIYLGTATPSTIPGTPTERVAYIGGPGTYNNFGTTVVVPSGSIVAITYNGSAWSKMVLTPSLPVSTTLGSDNTTIPTSKAVKDVTDAINTKLGEGYLYAGIATAATNPGTPIGKVFYLARQAGTYTNFGGLTLTEGVNILKYNGTAWSQEQLISIADIYRNPLMGYYECDTAGGTAAKTVAATGYVLPTTGGSVKIKMANRNTVANATLNINSTGAKPLYYNGQRAGVGNTWDTNEIVEVFYDGTNYQAYNVAGSNGDGVFDISAYNLTDGQPTPYVDLAAALGTNGEHVPQSLRKGGMSVKFIQGSVPSSDNKYVQYRLMSDTFSITESDWQGVDDEPTAGSDNLVKSGVVYQLRQDLDSLKENGMGLITKSLTWQAGYVNTYGQVNSSSLSGYAVVPMKKGESVTIGTNNANITIIGWTSADSVSVGDTIHILQKTTGAGVYEEYSYTCGSDVNLVLCVRLSDYNCSFIGLVPVFDNIQTELNKIPPLEASVDELNNITIQENQFEHLYIDNIDGVKSNVIFYKQYVKIDDTSHTSIRETIFTLTDVTEDTYLFSADKVTNYAYAGYLWVYQKDANDETIANSHTAWAGQTLTVNVAENCAKILFQLTPAYGTALSNPCEYYGIRVVAGNSENYHLTGRAKDVVTNLHDMNGFVVPDYYFENDYLQDKVARINELHDLYAMTGTSFVFITDEHWEHPKCNAQNSMSLLRYIYNNTHLDTLIDGGDNADKGSVEFCDLLRKAWGGHIYHLAGNHDYMNGGDEREAELFSMYDSYNYNQIGNKSRHYYYVDNERDKIRLVVLNSFKPSGSPSIIAAVDGYEPEQIAWASNVAFDVEAGWKIIVVGHGLYGFYDPDEPDPYEGWGEHIYIPSSHGAVIEAIENYSGNGEILAFFTGHSHIDRVVYTANKHIPVIHTNCDANTVSRHKTADPRTSGTTGEQCFDVVIYDSVGRKFHMVRIGTPAYNGIGTNVGNEVQERVVYVDLPITD